MRELQKRPTIHDVARLAGVSASTVSNALNGKGYIRESTRKAILDAADQLSYKPSAVARSLKAQQSRILGFFVSDMSGPVYSEIIAGAARKAEENGYEIVICNSHSREDRVLSSLLSYKMLDGCLVMSPELEDDVLRELARTLFPVVALDRDIDGERLGCVLMDNASSAYGIARLFRERGYDRIGYIGPNPEYRFMHDVQDRNRGFLAGVRDFGLDLPEERYRFGGFTMESGHVCMADLLALPVRPRAVFAANDEMALGALRAVKEQGLRVPDDVAVVGFDDILVSSYVSPRLSTVRRPCLTLGGIAVDLLFGLMKARKSHRLLLPTEIVLRESFT